MLYKVSDLADWLKTGEHGNETSASIKAGVFLD